MTDTGTQVRDLFLVGHTVEDVIAAGTTGGWGLNDVAELIQANGWVVDEDDLIHMPFEPGGCQCAGAQQRLRLAKKLAHDRETRRARQLDRRGAA